MPWRSYSRPPCAAAAGKLVLGGGILFVGVCASAALQSGERIFTRAGETDINIVTRLSS